jgi:hypothetical protein
MMEESSMQCLPVPAEHSMTMLSPAMFRFREDSSFEPQRLQKPGPAVV